MKRVIEREIDTLETLINEIEKDFKSLLVGIRWIDSQAFHVRNQKHLKELKTALNHLKNDLRWLEEHGLH